MTQLQDTPKVSVKADEVVFPIDSLDTISDSIQCAAKDLVRKDEIK